MQTLTQTKVRPYHYSRFGNTGFEFDTAAAEVAILDRSGRVLWTKKRGDISPIRWTGIDAMGQSLETGDYICKIVYRDQKVAYLPFVFMKKN